MGKQAETTARAAAADAARQAQEARAKKYGIGIKEGGAVTKPSEWTSLDDADFADPVNYRYPMPDKAHADNAASRWGDASNREQYSSEEQATIGKRILERQRSFGEDDKGERAMGVEGLSASDRVSMYFPITRAVDENGNFVVRGQCTSEAIDSYKTIFDYESAKRAMERWPGNVREQHDAKRAVAHRLNWEADDASKRILLTSFISRAEPGTRTKVEEGILTGYSVMLKPGFKSDWVTRNGQRIMRYYDYDYAEISLVDAPGSPNCDIQILRADGTFTDVTEEPQITPEAPAHVATEQASQEEVTRAGAAVSADRMSTMHSARDAALMSARQMAAACPCDECAGIVAALDPDGDGDVDIPGADSTLDPDADANDMAERVIAIVERRLAPTVARYQAIAGDMASHRSDEGVVARLAAMEEQIVQLTGMPTLLPDLLARINGVSEVVSRIAAQPASGGPALRAVDKRLATDPPGSGSPEMSKEEVVRRATEMGLIDARRMSPSQQLVASGAVIQPVALS